MIIQPERDSRNVNDLFYEAEKQRIDLLNQEFFQDVQLTKSENDVLVWLCGWDEWTINAMMAVFRRISTLSNGQIQEPEEKNRENDEEREVLKNGD